MMCPICPAAGWFGGWIGGYIGINAPQHPSGKIVSALITANLMGVTVLVLKSYFNVSICGGGSIPERIFRAGIAGLLLGIVYSIGVNLILNRFVFNAPAQGEDEVAPCCRRQ